MNTLRPLLAMLACLLLVACATHRPAGDASAAGGVVVDAPAQVAQDDTLLPATPADAGSEAAPVTAPVSAGATDEAVAQPTAGAQGADAEADYAAIYGTPGASANGVADAGQTAVYDPWEKYNRRVHAFNSVVDRHVAKPLAQAYTAVLPRPVRVGVGNFFDNLVEPVTVVNSLLQGNPRGAVNSLGRFLLNSTVGIGGVLDIATMVKMPERGEDFGQTLAVWGWKRSRYLEVPFMGPRTVRDTLGIVGDFKLYPIGYIESDKVRIPLEGIQAVDLRARLLSLESIGDGAVDEYALFRDIWLQRRNYQINQTGRRQQEDAPGKDLPPYLQDPAQQPDATQQVEPAPAAQ